MSKLVSRSISSASAVVITFTFLSRVLGVIREVVFASVFGTSREFDIFLLIAAVPLVLNNALIYLGQNFFVPYYHSFPIEDTEGRNFFLVTILKKFFFSGLLIAVVLFIFQRLFNYPGVSDNLLIEESAFVRAEIMLFATIPLAAAFSIIAAYLQAEFNFIIPSISQIFLNVSIIFFVFVFGDNLGMESIVTGYLVGYLIQILIVLAYIIKTKKIKFVNKSSHLKIKASIGIGLSYIVLIELINQSYTIIDRYFIAFIPEGGISALNYASVIYTAPIGIISLAFSSAIFPFMSKNINLKNYQKLSDDFTRSLKFLAFIFIPICCVFYIWADDTIKLLYGRGNFGEEQIILTSEVLKYLSVSIFFFASFAVINKIYYSMNSLKTLLIISGISVILKLGLNYLFVGKLLQNGLALSSSITYIFITILSLLILLNKIKIISILNFLLYLLKILLISSSALLAVYLINLIFQINLLSEIINLFLFLFIYMIISYLSKLDELKYIKNLLS